MSIKRKIKNLIIPTHKNMDDSYKRNIEQKKKVKTEKKTAHYAEKTEGRRRRTPRGWDSITNLKT